MSERESKPKSAGPIATVFGFLIVAGIGWVVLSAAYSNWSESAPEPTQAPPFTYVNGRGYVPTEDLVEARGAASGGSRTGGCDAIRDPDHRSDCYDARYGDMNDYRDDEDYADEPDFVDEIPRGR